MTIVEPSPRVGVSLDERLEYDAVTAGECTAGDSVWAWDDRGLRIDDVSYPPPAIGAIQLSSSTRIAEASRDWSPPTREAWLHLRVVLRGEGQARHDLSARVPASANLDLAGIPALEVEGTEIALDHLLSLVGTLHALKSTRPELDPELHPGPDLTPRPRDPVHIESPVATRWIVPVGVWIASTGLAVGLWSGDGSAPDGWALLAFAIAAPAFGVLVSRLLRHTRRITYDRTHHERTAPYVRFFPKTARFRRSEHDELALRGDADFLFRSDHNRLAIAAGVVSALLCFVLLPWSIAWLQLPDDAEVFDGWLGLRPLGPLYAPLLPTQRDDFAVAWTEDGEHLVAAFDDSHAAWTATGERTDPTPLLDALAAPTSESSPCTRAIPACSARYRGKVLRLGSRRIVDFSDAGAIIDDNGDTLALIDYGPGELLALGDNVLVVYFEQSHRVRIVRFRTPEGEWLDEPWMRVQRTGTPKRVTLSDDERIVWIDTWSGGTAYATEEAHAGWSSRPWRHPSAARAMHPDGDRLAVVLEAGLVYQLPIPRP